MKTEGQHAMEQSVKTSGIGGHCIKWFRVETCKQNYLKWCYLPGKTVKLKNKVFKVSKDANPPISPCVGFQS